MLFIGTDLGAGTLHPLSRRVKSTLHINDNLSMGRHYPLHLHQHLLKQPPVHASTCYTLMPGEPTTVTSDVT